MAAASNAGASSSMRREMSGDKTATASAVPDALSPRVYESGSTPLCRIALPARFTLGLIAGFIASKIVNKQGEGIVLDIILGIVGAVVGGWLFSMFGAQGVDGLNIYSMFVAVVGAIVVLLIYHAATGRRTV